LAVGKAPRLSFIVVFFFLGFTGESTAMDWTAPAQQLAGKIAAFTGPGTVAFSVQNRSSLSSKDVERIQSDLESQMEALGVHPVDPERAAGTVAVVLSENPQNYVWVAQMSVGEQSAVEIVAVERSANAEFSLQSSGMTLRKIPLWAQSQRILDVVVLEEDSAPKYLAVLDAEKVSLYRRQNTKWQREQILGIAHARPWPRDMRGRLVAARDHLLDAYLPGVVCHSATAKPLSLNCHESDDPWPLVVTSGSNFTSLSGASLGKNASPLSTVPPLASFYSASRNFFTGALAPGVQAVSTVAKFYSAAALPRDRYVLWLFAGADGQTHLVDGVRDQAERFGWGSDFAAVKTGCGSGWQVLASGAANGKEDTLRAYEMPDRSPVPVSAPLEIPEEITALWTEGRGDSAIAVARNRESGDYEAFRLAVACSQ
jgi:hypothetical protein